LKKNNKISITVDKIILNNRIDKYLSEIFREKSRSYIQKLIDNNLIKVNDNDITKNYILSKNDKIEINDIENLTLDSLIKPQEMDLNILFENENYLILSKDAGVVTHPAPGNFNNTIVNAVLYHFKNQEFQFSDSSRAGIVHRLDKDTSGLLIVAKNSETQRKLSDQFKSRNVQKEYVALVYGKFEEKKGEIVLPIGRSRIDRSKMKVSADRGREAQTNFEVIEEFNDCALLRIIPKTGRTHQIRVHLSYINHPVIGDKKYGNKNTESIAKSIGLDRQFLHAKTLKFLDPFVNREVKFEDNLAGDLLESLEKLRITKKRGDKWQI
jgi:23S rRNA pseudouridine1911/1915/1917 synthase